MTFQITLNRPQRWAWHSRAPGVTLVKPWGRGIGKSTEDRWWIYSMIAQCDGKHRGQLPAPYARRCPRPLRGIRIIAACDTLVHFKHIHRDAMLDELAPGGLFGGLGGKVDRQSMDVDFPGGSTIRVFPALEHVSQKGRGLRGDVLWIDEADDVPIATFNAVGIPQLSEPWSLRMITVSGTPMRGRHGLLYHLYERGIDPDVPHIKARRFTYKDAPETVDPQAVADARATMSEALFAREWECDFDAGEGLVYSVFDPDLHVRPTRDGARFSRIVVGVDWGYEDPGVFLVFGIIGHGKDAQVFLIEEHYQSHELLGYWENVARDIVRRYERHAPITFYADPSRPDSIKAIARATSRLVEGAQNKIEDGIATVANRFSPGAVDPETGAPLWHKMYIDPSCSNTIRELGEYRRKRDPKDRDRFLEAPEDRNNHAMDAMRYAMVGVFGLAERVKFEWSGSSSFTR